MALEMLQLLLCVLWLLSWFRTHINISPPQLDECSFVRVQFGEDEEEGEGSDYWFNEEHGRPLCHFYFAYPFRVGDVYHGTLPLPIARPYRSNFLTTSRARRGGRERATRPRGRRKYAPRAHLKTQLLLRAIHPGTGPSLEEVLWTIRDAWPPPRSHSVDSESMCSPSCSMGTGHHLTGAAKNRLSLPHRRYSVPETVMRKYSLSRQKSAESSESGIATVPTPSVPSAGTNSHKKPTQTMNSKRTSVSKACQTSPRSSLVSSVSLSSSYKSATKTLWDHKKKANSLDETTSTSKEIEDSQLYIDANFKDFEKYKSEILKEVSLPGEVILLKEQSSTNVLNSKTDDKKEENEIVEEVTDEIQENTENYVIEEDIKLLLENITKDMTIKLLLGFRTKSFPETEMSNLEKCKTKRDIKSAHGRLFKNEFTLKENDFTNNSDNNFENGDSTLSNIKDITQFEDTPSPQEQESPPQDMSPPKSGHSSDQSAECYITDCDICIAEGRKCCSLDNSSEVFSFTSPDMVMTTNELKTSSDFTTTSVTLDQTVTDRSTSTQDSTLSITSITPESYHSISTESRFKLNDTDRIPPSSVELVINTETTILDPIQTKESTKNLSFNLSESSECSEKMKKIPTQSLVITSECIVTDPIQCDNENMHYVLEMMETDSTYTEGSECTHSSNKLTQIDKVSIEITNKQHKALEEEREEKMYDSLEVTNEINTTENDVETNMKSSNKLKVLNIFLDRNVGFRQSIGSAFIDGNEVHDSITKRSMSCGEIPQGMKEERDNPANGESLAEPSDNVSGKTQSQKIPGEDNLEEEQDLLEELGFKEETKSGRTSSSYLELCGKKKDLSYEEMCKRQVQDMFYGNRTYEVLTNNTNNINNSDSTKRNVMGNVMSTSNDPLKSYVHLKKPQRQDAEVNESNVSFCRSNSCNRVENDSRLSGYMMSQQEITCDGNCNDEIDETISGNVIMLRIPLPTDDDGNPIPTCIEGSEIEQGKELIIPRYSAMPRTVSMLVNTSSADYSSDSELSLADSLEDVNTSEQGNSNEQDWANKHDKKMVRGDVISLLPENNKKIKRDQSREAYAYFVSLSGEMGDIKSETIPEPLKQKLMKRDSEVRRHIEHHHHHPRRKDRKSESLFKKTLKKKVPPLSQSDFYDSSSKEDPCRLRKAFSLTSGDSEERLIKQDSKSTQWEEFPEPAGKEEIIALEVVDEESIIKQKKESKWLKCVKLLRNDPELDKFVSDVLLSAALKDKDESELDEKIKNILLEALRTDEKNKIQKSDSNEEQVVPIIQKTKETSTEDIISLDEIKKDLNENEEPAFKSMSVQTTESSLHTTTCESFEFCHLCHENNLKEEKCYENSSKNLDNINQDTSIRAINGISKEGIDKFDNLISNNLKSDCKDKLVGTPASKNQQQSFDISTPTSEKKVINLTKSDKTKLDHAKHKASHTLSDKSKVIASKSPRSHSCLNNKQPNRIHPVKIPPRRSANTLGVRFHQKFEAIPEEKSGSMESSEDQQNSPKPCSSRRASAPSDILLLGKEYVGKRMHKDHDGGGGSTTVSEEKLHDVTEPMNTGHEQVRRHTIHGNIQLQDDDMQQEKSDKTRRHTVHGNIVGAGQISGLQTINLNVGSIMRGRVIGQRGNVMIGRFHPVNEETQVEKDENEKILIGEIERIRRKIYKGREALETSKIEEQDESMTLSKGWINFYLLRESNDLVSDQSIDDEGSTNSPVLEETKSVAPSLRTVNVVGKREDKVRQYTVQISASEEPTASHVLSESEEKLPGLSKTSKRSPRSSSENSDINLPGIPVPSPVTSPSSTKSCSPMFSKIPQQREGLPKLHSQKRSILSNSKIKSSAKKYITSKQEQKELSICTSTTTDEGYNYLHLPSPHSEIHSRTPTTPCPELSPTTPSSSTCDSRSESPVLPSIKWPIRHIQKKHLHRYTRCDTQRQQPQLPVHPVQNPGTCWTVTVAGNSGNPQQPPPDVEMRLSFPSNQQPTVQQPQQQFVTTPSDNTAQHNQIAHETKERRLRRAIQDPSPTPPQPCWSLTVKNKNQGEEKDERRSYHEKSSKRLSKKGYQYEGEERSEEEKGQFSFIWPKVEEILDHGPIRKPSIKSAQWSHNIQELSVTGLAITPEKKPRVPTMSERDITRVHYSRTKLF